MSIFNLSQKKLECALKPVSECVISLLPNMYGSSLPLTCEFAQADTVSSNTTFGVNFCSTALGSITGKVTIANNDPVANPITIEVTGAGVPEPSSLFACVTWCSAL